MPVTAPKRVMVTGASGFLGRHLVTALKQSLAPDDVVIAASRQLSAAGGDGAVVHALFDLADADLCRRVIDTMQPTHVVHLAGIASPADVARSVEAATAANVQNTIHLANACEQLTDKPVFLFASSGEVYGKTCLEAELLREDMTIQPASPYGHTKAAAEAEVSTRFGGRGIILRLFNSVGPGQDERFVVGAFAAQVARIEAGLVPPVLRVGNLSSVRDFLDGRDTVAAMTSLILRPVPSSGQSEVFNIASGHGRTISAIVDDLRALSQTPFEVELDPARARPSDIPRSVGDASKLRALTGWAPRHAWADTLRDTIEYWRAFVRAA
jgi:GDP-4-dehydro-6-deoxy-D-mannose reductase